VPVTIPLLKEPIERRRFVSCILTTDDGVTGLGLTGQFLPIAISDAINRDISKLLNGMDIRDTEAIHAKVWKSLNPRSQTGVISHALAATDIAMWDARGKLEGRSVAQLLGGYTDAPDAYVTFGFPEYEIDELIEAGRNQVEKGVSRLKMVVGVHKGGWQEDARRVHALREAIGDDIELSVDANYMFSPLDAYLFAREIEDARIVWFEEPLHTNDPRSLAELRSRVSIPIAGGQMDGHRWRFREFVDAHSLDILQPNVCYTGGYTEARKVGHLAQAFNIPIANGGGWPHFNMHLIAGLMNGWRVEFHLGMQQVGVRIFPDAP
jgi:L-alanine-DL-glutamate epimerase-like enolase superfamily enzyme